MQNAKLITRVSSVYHGYGNGVKIVISGYAWYSKSFILSDADMGVYHDTFAITNLTHLLWPLYQIQCRISISDSFGTSTYAPSRWYVHYTAYIMHMGTVVQNCYIKICMIWQSIRFVRCWYACISWYVWYNELDTNVMTVI